MSSAPASSPRHYRPDPRIGGSSATPLTGPDFVTPLHPDRARQLARRAYGLLRLVVAGLVVALVVLGLVLGSVAVLVQALVTAAIGLPLLMALRVLLDAALSVIAGVHDDRRHEHERRHGGGGGT